VFHFSWLPFLSPNNFTTLSTDFWLLLLGLERCIVLACSDTPNPLFPLGDYRPVPFAGFTVSRDTLSGVCCVALGRKSGRQWAGRAQLMNMLSALPRGWPGPKFSRAPFLRLRFVCGWLGGVKWLWLACRRLLVEKSIMARLCSSAGELREFWAWNWSTCVCPTIGRNYWAFGVSLILGLQIDSMVRDRPNDTFHLLHNYLLPSRLHCIHIN